MNKPTIRQATKQDTPLILRFIGDLASYENMSDDVVATEELLNKWIFEDKKAEVVFVCEEEKEVGFALYFYNFSTFLGRAGIYLEDLYIDPQYRNKGYGKALIKHLAAKALDEGCGRFEWQCLDWNKPSIAFYESLGAMSVGGWIPFRLTGDALERVARS
ncbi:MAG: GNAT family N-acetyltransferase [Eggerthellaceae bacterium]|nr:GNAT family N-acetyltransferase [Eggerthellaceae bacterium]